MYNVKEMITKWYSNLSNRTIAFTIVICIFMLYFSYTFNSCLVSTINRTFRKNSMNYVTTPQPNVSVIQSDPAEITILGSIVRIVPLTAVNTSSNNNNNNIPVMLGKNQTSADIDSTKYRFLRKQGIQPNRHLPDTLIIGVKKSGTRALLEFIRLHPDVRAAGCEVHFFDRHYFKGFEWYRNHMPSTIEGQITMEKTPSYFVTKEVPKRVFRMNGKTKLLIVVRDPVTRAISDYTQAASKKIGMKKFEELAFLNGSYEVVDTSWGPVKIGVYAKHLERWLQYFQLPKLLFISGERLIVDPAVELGRVQDFLGLKRVVTEKHFYFNSTKGFPCLLKSEARSTPHCLGKTKGRNHPYIDPMAIDRLRDFYRPFNRKFYQMTGINFEWP